MWSFGHDPWLAQAEEQKMYAPRPLPFHNSFRVPAFQQNWSFPADFRQSHHRLHRYLPLLVQAAYEYRVSLDETCQLLASCSDGIVENGSFAELDGRQLLAAYLDLVQIIQSFPRGHDISAYIRQQLNMSLVESDRSSRYRSWRRHSNSAPTLFRAYAEISDQTKSRPLANILASFLRGHLRSIVLDDINDLAIWAHSISRSFMKSDERYACLAFIIQSRPELIEELGAARMAAAEELWPYLEEIARDLGISSGRRPGRSPGRIQSGITSSAVVQGTRPRRTGRWGNRRSSSPSPIRGSLQRRSDSPLSIGDRIFRPLSAPGDRSLIRQADRVIELAEGTMEEAERLKYMAKG